MSCEPGKSRGAWYGEPVAPRGLLSLKIVVFHSSFFAFSTPTTPGQEKLVREASLNPNWAWTGPGFLPGCRAGHVLVLKLRNYN